MSSTASPTPPALHKLKQALWRWPVMLVAGLVAAWLLFAYLAVDPLARWLLPKVGESQLASQLQAERVAFDPFRLKLTVDKLRLTRRDGAPLAGFQRLVIDMEASGLFRWAWRFKEIRLTGPEGRVDVAPDGKLNWSELLAQLNAGKPNEAKDDGTTPRLLVDHLLIEDGNLEYLDRNRPVPFKAAMHPLGLELEGLSTLPVDRGRYLVAANLPEQGGTLKWRGEIALNPLASAGELDLAGVKLGKLLAVVKSPDFPVSGAQGDIAASLKYRFAMAAGATASDPPYPYAQVDELSLKLDGVAADLRAAGAAQARVQAKALQLRIPGLTFSQRDKLQLKFADATLDVAELALTREGSRLLGLGNTQVKGVAFDLDANQLKVAELLLQQGSVQSRRGKDGRIDWQQLADALSPAPAPGARAADAAKPANGAPQPAAKPLRFALDRVRLEQWQLRHQDAAFTNPLEVAASGLQLELAADNEGGAAKVKGINGALTGISLKSSLAPQPVATLASVAWRDGVADVGERSASLGSVVVSGLQTQVLRGADGSLNWEAIFASANAGPAAPAKAAARQRAVVPVKAPAPAAKAAGDKPWTAKLARLALENAAIRVEDRSTRKPMSLDLRAGLELRDASLDLSQPVPLKARVQVAQGGEIEVEGKVTPEPAKADLQVRLNQISLKPFSPYVNQPTVLKLDDGRLSARGKLTVDAGSTLKASYRGGFAVRQLAISHEDTSEPFVAWKEVSSDSVNFSLAPRRLHLQTLRIVQPVGQFIIHEDGTMNATRILRSQIAATAAAPSTGSPVNVARAPAPAPTQAPRPVAAPPSEAAPGFPIAIERVSIVDANVDFADLTLRPQFGTKIDNLSGVVNGLSNDPATTAQVELDGQVDEFGSARVRGTVQPFRATQFTDLKLSFRNLEMSRLTPYSGKFAGRKIESGKLSVDLEYKIRQRLLAGENKFVVNKLKLGERVDSPDALSLPLDLAIAILQDGDGLIDLDLPISGSLDDPQFSYGKIIWKAIGNLLTRIVTAPFRALGSLLGANAERMQAIAFDPGSAALAPQEQEKLQAVAQALAKRPALQLTIVPGFNTANDTTALQEVAMRRGVLAESGQKLRESEAPGPLDLNNTRIQSAVERLLKQRTTGGISLKLLDDVKDAVRTSKPQDVPRYAEMLPRL
ncbi:MAG TPA: DUF748 domain-containing protein, partial [Ramlibacter sp.]|nr:DUF748 domain-containing protein [Ramlibacter sp.]